MKDSVAWYNKHASAVTPKYESVNPDSLHDWMTDLLPEPPALVLDVGSGTGRDAAWFASKGFDVFAVEPSRAMREIACTPPPLGLRVLDERLASRTGQYVPKGHVVRHDS